MAKTTKRRRRSRTYADSPQGKAYAQKKFRARPVHIVISATNRHDMQDQINRQLEAGYRAPESVARDIVDAVVSFDFGSNTMMVARMKRMFDEFKKETILKIFESLVDVLHDYIIYLIENQDSLLPEFSAYPRLSQETMDYGVHPHDRYFFDWSGDLINEGIRIVAEEGKSEDDFPSIKIEIVDGIHESPVSGSMLEYRTLFKFLEYGTKHIPPRPFFGVIEYKVEEFIKKAVDKIHEGKHVDTVNFSWA